MKTLFNEALRTDLESRVSRVSTDARPRWGKMNAEQMLAHLTESLRMATGELKTKSKRMPIRYFPLKQLIIYVAPFPKGAPTAPELLPSDARGVEQSKSDMTRLMRELGTMSSRADWPEHPAFGRLTTRAWGVLTYRHMD